mmetsp:Transcript_20619/g.24995  ORF Transcript_20619/g.24995 Transcript_20619/m.24995 type:complete len:176 (-) Transcript_20619:1213-1740(-)
MDGERSSKRKHGDASASVSGGGSARGKEKLEFVRAVPKFLQQFSGMIKDKDFTKKAQEAAENWRDNFQKKQKVAMEDEVTDEDLMAYEDAKKFGTIVSAEDAMVSEKRKKEQVKQEKMVERRTKNEKNEKMKKLIKSMAESNESSKETKKKKKKNKKKLNNRMLLSFDTDGDGDV